MTDWQPIETAPKDGTIVRLRSPSHEPKQAFYWSKKAKRWETIQFGVMGRARACWDPDAEQPTEWKRTP